ncbi:hypothetical protein R3W88_025145 [Solanum pinnatisectum]|uniref:Uncharacterized protein n=1 Tax=Solanum pinnatisectum TaxID=50273 RepID=A0AAV9M2R8_9SOLN|nr:hypothetical protein R3W88_025145 [Solanum pinnatisectum]
MSILSKTWLQAWSTLSNLKFRVEYFKCDLKIVDDIMNRYRDGKIPIEKFELLENDHHSFFDNFHEVLAFPSIDEWLDIALTNGVKDLDLYLT